MEFIDFIDLTSKNLDLISQKHYDHWKKYSNELNLEIVKKEFKTIYNQSHNSLPIGFAMVNKNKLIGFCCLKLTNIKSCSQYYPWISNVLIFEKYRNKGYGTKLIHEALRKLKSLKFKIAYIWTDQAPQFYEKLGFEFLKVVEKDDGTLAKLYKINL